MKPLILAKHDESFSRIRELLPEELDMIAGGACGDTIFVTANGDGGYCTGCDCDNGGC